LPAKSLFHDRPGSVLATRSTLAVTLLCRVIRRFLAPVHLGDTIVAVVCAAEPDFGVITFANLTPRQRRTSASGTLPGMSEAREALRLVIDHAETLEGDVHPLLAKSQTLATTSSSRQFLRSRCCR
jgi:hypothetical protein